MIFKRLKEHYIADFVDKKQTHKDVLILSGARQVGKSTLLQTILHDKAHLLINLEKSRHFLANLDLCEEFSDFEDLLKDQYQFAPQNQVLVIDEAQMSQKLGRFIRFMKEDWQNATVILTGSLIHELHTQDNSRSAVGREIHTQLWPMSFKEFLMALNEDSLVKTMQTFALGQKISDSKHARFIQRFEDYLKVGGLPAVVQVFKDGGEFEKTRKDIYLAYEDDFIRYFSLDDVNLFRRSLDSVAANVGSPSKDSQVVRLDAPGYKKVAGIFSRLEKWNITIKSEQLQLEPEKNKAFPKRYLYDVGVLNDLRLRGVSQISLTDLSLPSLRAPLGGLIENAIALSLKIQFEDIFGMKLHTQNEIDFAVKYQGRVVPIEVKMNSRFKNPFLTGLKTYLTHHAPAKSLGFLFYGGTALEKADQHIWSLPYYFTDELKRILAEQI